MSPQVHLLEDPSAVAAEVARRLLERVTQLQEGGDGPLHLVLTGGTIADAVHHQVARGLDDAAIDWSRVHLWFGDERFVDEESEDRNALQARQALTGELGARGATVHEIAGTRAAASPEEAARLYAAELEAYAVDDFDLLMLGVGPDGHVASLFPQHPGLEATGSAAGVHDSPKPPPDRVTLTLERLNRARATWFIATGQGKADAVAAVLGSDDTVESLPAGRVALSGDVEWFLDAEAAPHR